MGGRGKLIEMMAGRGAAAGDWLTAEQGADATAKGKALIHRLQQFCESRPATGGKILNRPPRRLQLAIDLLTGLLFGCQNGNGIDRVDGTAQRSARGSMHYQQA